MDPFETIYKRSKLSAINLEPLDFFSWQTHYEVALNKPVIREQWLKNYKVSCGELYNPIWCQK